MPIQKIARYLKIEKYWEIPNEKSIIAKLQAIFGENLIIYHYFFLVPLQKELFIRKYFRRTIKSYVRYSRDFRLFVGKKLEEVENEEIKKFLYYMVKKKQVSVSTLNIIINA